MSGRGGFRGGFRGGRGSGRGGFRGGRGGGGAGYNQGPPESIVEAGEVLHEAESYLVVKGLLQQQVLTPFSRLLLRSVMHLSVRVDKVPYFNGRIFLENKQEIGKVDEILGPINQMYFSVKLNDGIKASSIKPTTKTSIRRSLSHGSFPNHRSRRPQAQGANPEAEDEGAEVGAPPVGGPVVAVVVSEAVGVALEAPGGLLVEVEVASEAVEDVDVNRLNNCKSKNHRSSFRCNLG
ncbi:GAR1 protein RNA binding region protein [Cyclospora cayetanensis]|uniref:H/ACA ribonucleoprotein complex subunit n=1 Tax=Cyclospora cayetanensis TaxID=88456 RepID=A0A1D3DAV9_9EIME|nr:GAR1 protein RNA binding region protein [Cyclospora cayetanensis]